MSRQQYYQRLKQVDKSALAKKQPRDGRGRFAKYDAVIVVDEFGNAGNSKEHERTFGYAFSITTRPDSFGGITNINRKKSPNREIKASEDKSAQIRMSEKIVNQGTYTYGYYVNKKNPPIGWDNNNQQSRMIGTLDYSLDRVITKMHGNIFVIVDGHQQYKGKVKPLIESKSTKTRIITGDTFNSKDGQFSDLLQTHDYVANSVHAAIESNDYRRTKIMKTELFKIDCKTNISYNKK